MDKPVPEDDLDSALRAHDAELAAKPAPSSIQPNLAALPPNPCRYCGFDCRGVLSETCPECGRHFSITAAPDVPQRGMYCMRCRADLRQEKADDDGKAACPECGLRFVPADPATYTRYIERETAGPAWSSASGGFMRWIGSPLVLVGAIVYFPLVLRSTGGMGFALVCFYPVWLMMMVIVALKWMVFLRPGLCAGWLRRVGWGLLISALPALPYFIWTVGATLHGRGGSLPIFTNGPLVLLASLPFGFVGGFLFDLFGGE